MVIKSVSSSRFNDCSISGDNFNILSETKILPRLNRVNFTRCEILSFEFWYNNFTATELSRIFWLKFSVWDVLEYKEYQEKKTILGGVKHLLLGSPSLCYFQFLISEIEDFLTNLVEPVEKHPSLLYLETRNKR
eukprot:snap_masked-scaffold_22-processed-gene-5.31-mRNA-1 protein AED:1.00 eAED:1.00 QI:0/0/0/0/1/1/6/0/133